MNLEYRNPNTVHKPGPYTHAVVVNQGRIAYLAGQVAWDKEGEVVGVGDLQAQTRQVFENIKAILTDLGASFDNVIKITLFVVDYAPDKRSLMIDVANDYLNPERRPASTLLGVQALARPELLIEVEAVVALPG